MERALAELLEPRLFFSTIRFAVIGDFGSAGPNELAVVNLVKSLDPDLVLTVSDGRELWSKRESKIHHNLFPPFLYR